MNKSIHEHSRRAHDENKSGLYSERQRAILEVFRRRREPLSDRAIMRELGFVDPNKVRPSITTLVELRVLFEVGQTLDTETNKTVRLCWTVEKKDDRQLDLFS